MTTLESPSIVSIVDRVDMDCNNLPIFVLLFPTQCFYIFPRRVFFLDRYYQDSIYNQLLLPMSEALKFNLENSTGISERDSTLVNL